MKYIWQIGGLLAQLGLVAATATSVSFAQTAPPAHSAGMAGMAIRSSYLGVNAMDVDGAKAKTLKLKDEHGVEITGIDASGPAAKAGVKVGDVVLEYNGQPVKDSQHLQRLVRETLPGHEAKLSVWRNGAAQTLTATIENRHMAMIEGEPWFAVPSPSMPPMPTMPSMPPVPAMSSNWPYVDIDIPRIQTLMQNSALGITGEPLGDEQQFAEFFGVKDGILVKAVESSSLAEHAGIKAGDVIVKVGDTRVGSLRELTAALRTVRAKGTYTLTVVRNKKETPLTVVSAQ